MRLIGHAEQHQAVVAGLLDAARDHQAAETEALVRVLACCDVARGDEERDAVGEREQHEAARAAQQQKRDDDQESGVVACAGAWDQSVARPAISALAGRSAGAGCSFGLLA